MADRRVFIASSDPAERDELTAQLRAAGFDVGDDAWGEPSLGTHERETGMPEIAGTSVAADELRRAIAGAAEQRAPVLLTGGHGAPFGRVALAIHMASPFHTEPFVSLSCAVLPGPLAAAELAGGAGTGRIAAAGRGTLFLEDLDALSEDGQTAVALALEGNARIVGSTTQPAARFSADQRVRADLRAAFSAGEIAIPSLRQRLPDLPALVERFLASHRRRFGGVTAQVSSEALERLAQHDWSGDVAELSGVLERAVAIMRGSVIGAADLIFGDRPAEETELPAERSYFKASVAAFERDLIVTALRDAGGNRSRAAELLGIYRRLLYAKIKDYGLERNPRTGER